MVAPEYFEIQDGQPGLSAKYYKDADRKILSKEEIDPDIDFVWYTGRPDYLTDSTYAVTWDGKLIPKETGKYQFHLISYDPKRIILNSDTLKMVYTSVEQYTEPVNLIAGRKYNFILETENQSTGAAKIRLFWKTPSIFAKEETKENVDKKIKVYIPDGYKWYDFWTGDAVEEGKEIKTDAPIDKIPLFVKAGSIVPMGAFIQYSTEKPADPIELRIYPGKDGSFTLYEDENDNYNYEKGIYSTINFKWDDSRHELRISNRKGSFPGMLKKRTFNIILVKENHGNGLEICSKPDKVLVYDGSALQIKLEQ